MVRGKLHLKAAHCRVTPLKPGLINSTVWCFIYRPAHAQSIALPSTGRYAQARNVESKQHGISGTRFETFGVEIYQPCNSLIVGAGMDRGWTEEPAPWCCFGRREECTPHFANHGLLLPSLLMPCALPCEVARICAVASCHAFRVCILFRASCVRLQSARLIAPIKLRIRVSPVRSFRGANIQEPTSAQYSAVLPH